MERLVKVLEKNALCLMRLGYSAETVRNTLAEDVLDQSYDCGEYWSDQEVLELVDACIAQAEDKMYLRRMY